MQYMGTTNTLLLLLLRSQNDINLMLVCYGVSRLDGHRTERIEWKTI